MDTRAVLANLKLFNAQKRTGYLLLTPALSLLTLVFLYPIARAFWLSFQTQNLGTRLQPVFSWFTNYSRMWGDGRFWQSLGNTLIFTFSSVSIELVLGLCVALVLNESFRGRGLVRTLSIIPWALPTAIMGLAWSWIFNDQYGVVNDLLSRLSLIDGGINWLGEPTLAMVALVIADVWKTTPFIAIILLAGLQNISPDLYEAYSLDGANSWQRFWKITLPLILPQLSIALLFRFAQAFGIFDLVQVMTGGGPAGATETVSIYIYTMIMRYLDFGYGAALVVVTFLLLVAVIAGVNIWLKRLGVSR
ncbi:MAG: Trehalose transport system permease protein SugA [Chroococcopsis gigantea SAG 12.99]|jgi:multiple sugar transport system permease protein|nr:Trehalose transport system permease protein SugA [Chroococcopsis gigantea SAG 12.99]